MFARLLVLLCLAAPAMAQTPLSGRISSDRTLVASESPYLVTSTVEVDAGVTFTVPAGVELQFRDNTSLVVRGTVEAMLPEHEVFITDWQDARMVPLSEGPFDLDDYIDYVIGFLEHIGPGAHVVRTHGSSSVIGPAQRSR